MGSLYDHVGQGWLPEVERTGASLVQEAAHCCKRLPEGRVPPENGRCEGRLPWSRHVRKTGCTVDQMWGRRR